MTDLVLDSEVVIVASEGDPALELDQIVLIVASTYEKEWPVQSPISNVNF